MPSIAPHQTDDAEFIDLIQPVIRGEIDAAAPELVFVTRIDHWFDAKWVSFTGKALGALGYWKSEVDRCTVPPFVTSRVLSESCFERTPAGRYEKSSHAPLHVVQPSARNQQRSILRVVGRPSVLVWFSSATAENGHGSLMLYDWTPTEWRAWHVMYRRNGCWRILRARGISRNEIERLSHSAAARCN